MSDETTLRDTFAAAALTGMLRKLRPGSVFDLTITARQAFELADAMLRERARTNSADLSTTLRNGAPAACETVPLTLTEAERGAMVWAIEVADSLAECSGAGTGGEPSREANTLRALLARLGGDA